MDDIRLAGQFVALAFLLILSGLFSIAETSMMAVNRYRLKALVRLGNRGAEIVTELLAQTDKLLGVILFGNNLVNAASASLVALILGRTLYGWRGRTALRWTLAGFVMLLLAYVGSRFVLEVLPGRN